MGVTGEAPERCPAGELYRVVVEGELMVDRAGWFGAQSLKAANGRTELVLEVMDQAELHGLLRRIRDINLRIVELTRIGQGSDS